MRDPKAQFDVLFKHLRQLLLLPLMLRTSFPIPVPVDTYTFVRLCGWTSWRAEWATTCCCCWWCACDWVRDGSSARVGIEFLLQKQRVPQSPGVYWSVKWRGEGGMPWSTSIYVQLEEPSRLLYVGINRLAFGTDNGSLAIDIDRQADRWTGDLSEGSYWSVNRNTQSRWIWIESQCWGGLEVQFKTGKKNLYYENIPVIEWAVHTTIARLFVSIYARNNLLIGLITNHEIPLSQ